MPMESAEIFKQTCLQVQSHLQTSPPTPQKSYAKFWMWNHYILYYIGPHVKFRKPRTLFENIPPFFRQRITLRIE